MAQSQTPPLWAAGLMSSRLSPPWRGPSLPSGMQRMFIHKVLAPVKTGHGALHKHDGLKQSKEKEVWHLSKNLTASPQHHIFSRSECPTTQLFPPRDIDPHQASPGLAAPNQTPLHGCQRCLQLTLVKKEPMHACSVTQLCLTLCDPIDCSLTGSSVHGDSPGKNTEVGCHALLQEKPTVTLTLPLQAYAPLSPQLRAGTPSLQCSRVAELRGSWTKCPWNRTNPPTTMHQQCDQSDSLSTFPCSNMQGGCYTLPWPCPDAGTSEFMSVKMVRSGPSGSSVEPGYQPLRTHASGVERLPSLPQHSSSWVRSTIGAEKQGVPTQKTEKPWLI